jgi:tetratricopeptide (TPR) repeat protein
MANDMSQNKDFIAQNSLGSTYHELGDCKKSLAHYERAAMIYQQLIIKDLLKDNDNESVTELPLDKVYDLIDRLKANPTFAIILSNLSSCYLDLGDLESATEFAEDSIQFCPPNYRHLSPHRILKIIEKLVGQNTTNIKTH